MEHKSCPVFVDGKECDRPLTLVDLEGKKIARYDLATYECNLRHRTYFLLEPKQKAKPYVMTRQEIEQRMDALAREYHDTYDPEIRKEIYRLARQLGEMKKQ